MDERDRQNTSTGRYGWHELVRRALEGDRLWGSLETPQVGRAMWSRFRITVYEPGTNALERRALHFHRTWPLAGAVIALFLVIALDTAWPTAIVVPAVLAMYFGGIWASARATRHLRSRSRRLHAVFVIVGGAVEVHGPGEQLIAAMRGFDALDDARRSDSITPAEYEAGWAEIYNSLEDVDAESFRVDRRS